MNASGNILPMKNSIRLAADRHIAVTSPQERSFSPHINTPSWGYIIATLNQYKYWILLLSLISALGAGLFASMQPPQYRGTTTLLIETRENKLTDIEGIYGLDTKRSTFLETQFALLHSRNVALRSMEHLDLDAFPEYSFQTWEEKHASGGQQNILHKIIAMFSTNTPASQSNRRIESDEQMESSAEHADWRNWQLDKFRKHISISPVTNTQLVEIYFDSNSPDLSANAANAIADSYINMQLLTAAKATSSARNALSQQLEKIKQDLVASETNLQAFREENGLVGLSGGVTVLAEEKIQQLSTKKLKLQMKLATLAENLELINKAGKRSSTLIDIPAIRNDSVVQQKNEQVNKARQEAKALRNKFFDGHPDLIVAEETLKNAIRDRNLAISSVAASIRNEYNAITANIEKISTEITDANKQLEGIQAHQVKLKSLERATDENRSLFNSFFKRLRETDAIDGLGTTPRARIIDPAVTPDKPIKPNVPVALVMGGLLGGLLTILWMILQVLRSKTILDIAQTRNLPIQVLGSLPKIKARQASREITNSCLKPHDLFAEQVQIIATDLKLLLQRQEPQAQATATHKLLFVTSAVESQGKTTIAASLAISYAQMGLRVLLIDSDKRMQELVNRLKINRNHPGFTDYLSARKPFSSCIQRGPVNGLHVMGFGKLEPAILHRMSQTGRINKALIELKSKYDLIIVDSAPLAVTAETRELMSYSDALIFVSTPETSDMSALKLELEKLQAWSKAPRYLIINKFDENKTMKYGSYAKSTKYYA